MGFLDYLAEKFPDDLVLEIKSADARQSTKDTYDLLRRVVADGRAGPDLGAPVNIFNAYLLSMAGLLTEHFEGGGKRYYIPTQKAIDIVKSVG